MSSKDDETEDTPRLLLLFAWPLAIILTIISILILWSTESDAREWSRIEQPSAVVAQSVTGLPPVV